MLNIKVGSKYLNKIEILLKKNLLNVFMVLVNIYKW